MLKHRLIPVVLIRDGVCVQSKGFKRYQALGTPYAIVERLSDWASDELIYLDISREGRLSASREDLNFPMADDMVRVVHHAARQALMPLTVGGGIRSEGDVEERLAAGADKVSINSAALHEPDLLRRCSEEFGAQCIVVSIDVRRSQTGWEVFGDGGRIATGRDPESWSRQAEDLGAGEVLITSIDEDGRGRGYDLDLVAAVAAAVQIPVIALGGVGSWDHLGKGLDAGATAVAAANIFHYSENSVMNAKRHLAERGYPVRPCELPGSGR